MAKPRGRKPSGPYQGNTVMLAVRVQPGLKAAIAAQAKRNGRSASQVIQFGLNDWMRRNDPASAHVETLVRAVALMVRHIELATEQKWTENAFTAGAVYLGMRNLLSALSDAKWPAGELTTPPAINALEERLPPEARPLDELAVGEAGAGFAATMLKEASRDTPGLFFIDEFGDLQVIRDLLTGGDKANAQRTRKRAKR